MSTEMQRFGQKLRALRIRNHMTLKELAQALGYTAHGHISELESGKKAPTAEFVLNVARLFGVSTDQLSKDELEVNIAGDAPAEPPASLAFIERNPTPNEVEKVRLLLSTYQDGSGMLSAKQGKTLPGWRDFERSIAAAFNGEAPENKAVFDVVLTPPLQLDRKFGLSCKMRRELNRIARTGRVSIELSNSAGQFWDYLNTRGIRQSNYRQYPLEVGTGLIEVVRKWHTVVSATVEIARSYYLVLSWNSVGLYQLHQFALELPDPRTLNWYFPMRTGQGRERPSRSLRGDEGAEMLFEWYGESGGQLKYYPRADSAVWRSEPFHLEPLPTSEYGVQAKATAYFPALWAAACRPS